MATLSINGQSYFTDSPPDTPLMWVIREDLRLTGTKFGCGQGLCGSCTVHVNGQPVRSCMVKLADAEGAIITTIEGSIVPPQCPSAHMRARQGECSC